MGNGKDNTLYTARDAAAMLEVSLSRLRKVLKQKSVSAVDVRKTGLQGRPAALYTLDSIKHVLGL